MSEKQLPILATRLLVLMKWHMASLVQASVFPQMKAEVGPEMTHSVPRQPPCFANACVAMTQILMGIWSLFRWLGGSF